MGKVTGWSIVFDGNQKVYRPGETVSGQAVIKVEGQINVKGVYIGCYGLSLTKWSRLFQRSTEEDSMTLETYVSRNIRVVDQNTVLDAGEARYKFSFPLPSQGLPSSFEGEFGAIRYFIKLELDKPFPAINDRYYTCFTVLAYINVNDVIYRKSVSGRVEKSLSKALGLGTAGHLRLAASLDRSGYCPGEQIFVNLEASNESTKDCGLVKASLVQLVRFTASSESKTSTTVIRCVLGARLAKDSKVVWQQQPVFVDAVPPSSKQLTCQNIKVTYALVVCIEVPLGLDLTLTLPIKLGTVPLGVSLPDPTTPRDPGQRQAAPSRALCYVPCQAGLQTFDQSHGPFVYLSRHAPMTVYVDQKSAARGGAAALQTTPSCAPPHNMNTSDSLLAAARDEAATTKGAEAATTNLCPTAPPLNNGGAAPPTYEQAVASALTPYLHQPGKGCVLMLVFQETDAEQVRQCFRQNLPNLMLHKGTILSYSLQLQVLPPSSTSAIFLHFQSAPTGLSWFQNMKLYDPALTSRWWVMLGENKLDLGSPGRLQDYTAASLVLMRRHLAFRPDRNYTELRQRLLKQSLNPTKKRFGGKTVLSSANVTFLSGDWSEFPAKSEELTMVYVQWPSVQDSVQYRQAFRTDPDLVQYKQLTQAAYTTIFTCGFAVGDVNTLTDLHL
ncbi:uncharacterized protein LOC131957802 [Physella acuta]|uniref:uncharacterized protein LOC131957802 n=1 Tax=Physella acuta TaxID=109671 RepID=UPI0027DAE650|nr:uncharacterized protein LOC131957802 [Physella acuta]